MPFNSAKCRTWVLCQSVVLNSQLVVFLKIIFSASQKDVLHLSGYPPTPGQFWVLAQPSLPRLSPEAWLAFRQKAVWGVSCTGTLMWVSQPLDKLPHTGWWDPPRLLMFCCFNILTLYIFILMFKYFRHTEYDSTHATTTHRCNRCEHFVLFFQSYIQKKKIVQAVQLKHPSPYHSPISSPRHIWTPWNWIAPSLPWFYMSISFVSITNIIMLCIWNFTQRLSLFFWNFFHSACFWGLVIQITSI